MYLFGNDKNVRGCFIAFSISADKSRGASLKLPGGLGDIPGSSYSDPILVTGVSMSQVESAQFLKCFGDVTYTYAFGHDPKQSQCRVQFAAMLRSGTATSLTGGGGGGSGGNATGIVQKMLRNYEKARVYKSRKFAKLYLGDKNMVVQGFVVGMASSTLDPQTSIQGFELALQLVEAQGV